MKTKTQFIARMLTIYMLSLPSFLIFHTLTSHSRNHQLVDRADFGDIALEDNLECQFCNLYFDQQLFSEDTAVFVFDTAVYYINQSILEHFFYNAIDQRYLRGPPSLI